MLHQESPFGKQPAGWLQKAHELGLGFGIGRVRGKMVLPQIERLTGEDIKIG